MLSNNEEPPPYLVVGTEVSAKFKGAFCEAKITRVDKNVRCKITYKNSNQQVTVSDEQIRSISTGKALAFNEFKIGTLVDVIKNNENNNNEQQHEAAMLNKILDQSSYTVVFNDGDEKILKRTFIRFKGEKHYLDSETLNNAPLNNPEHFLYPIKQHNNINNNNATDQVALSPSTTIKTTNSSAKSSPNNLPKRTSNQTDDEESIDEEDSTHLSKPPEAKKPKKNIKRRTISKDEIETEAQEEERIAHDLQQSDGGGDDRDSGTESDSSSSSDDYPSEIKDRFVAQLYKFMDDRGTPMNRLPTINCVDIDLHRFFIVVRKYGGFNKVCKLGNWINVYKRLNLPNVSHSSNVANLRSAYKRYLQPFEDFYRKLGSTMLDLVSKHVVYNTNSAKRNTSDSHRSLQLFKNRVLTPSSQKKGLSKFKQKQAAAAAAISSANSTSPLTTASATPTTVTTSIDSSLNDTIQQRKESIDSVADLAEFKQTTDLLQQTQQLEEITLSSMVRNLNENFKKAKRQEKEKKLTIVDDSDTQSKDTNEPKISNQQLPSTSTPAGSSGNSQKKITLTKIKQQQTPTSETTKLLSKKKPSSSSVSSTSSSSSSSSSNNKVTPLIEVDNNNNDFEDEDDDSLDESKPKRKVNRLSASGSEETQTILDTKKKLGMKRKHSLTCSKSTNNTATSPSNTETNEDSDDLQTSLKETEYKTNLTINDLEVNKIVDVKYANGSQKREYKAKIVQINTDNQTVLVHYLGWNTRYDEWVKMDRIKRMVNENFNSHKRRKSNKLKTNNQKADSPSSSSSSHPNESPEKKETINKNLNHKILLKKNERSSSSSTTSSLCDPVKDTETTTNENMKLNKFRNSGSTTISEVKTIDSNKSQLQIDSESQIEQTIDLVELKTPCDSLLSIKEEIIESENQEPIITVLSTNDDYSNNDKDKLEPDPDKSSDNIKNVTPKTIERNNKKLNEPLKIIKTETNLNSSNSKLTLNVSPSIIDNQENNKSQTIKSPSLPSLKSSHDRQINQQQQPVISDKVLNNQTNCLNENHIILESEDDNKKKTDSKSQSLPANDECSNTISLKKSEVHSSQQHQQQQLISLENYKYTFNLNDVSLIGKQRIGYIEEQMRACREMYAKLKNEIAAIDRKKKKLKRSILETSNNKSGYLNSLACSSSSSNNDDSSVQYSNLKAHKN